VFNRFYILPPGTPQDREGLLRKAFLADTQRAKLDLDPIDGEAIQKQVRGLFKLEPALVAMIDQLWILL